jgi:hypothetical protein
MEKRLDGRLLLQNGEQVGSCMWMQSRGVKKGWTVCWYCRVLTISVKQNGKKGWIAGKYCRVESIVNFSCRMYR